MTSILISPGFGAGWSTWNTNYDPTQQAYMLTHGRTIEAIRMGEELTTKHWDAFEEDWKYHFGDEYVPYEGGFFDLVIREVDGPFIVEEYDGSESLRVADAVDWWYPYAGSVRKRV